MVLREFLKKNQKNHPLYVNKQSKTLNYGT